MTGAEVQASYFTPLHYLLYLGIIFVLMVVWYLWKWAKDCRENVLVLEVHSDGSTSKHLVPKEGSNVTLKSPKDEGTGKTWVINQLATIDMLYPGVSFVPEFVQRSIKMVIVDDSDWEPLLNRGSYNENVASPDVKKALALLAETDGLDGDVQTKLKEFAENLNTAPTRAMIASPSMLFNLINEKITEAVITINKEVLDSIGSLMKRLDKMPNPTIIYVGLGLILILTIYNTFAGGSGDVSKIADDVIKIKQSLGIP